MSVKLACVLCVAALAGVSFWWLSSPEGPGESALDTRAEGADTFGSATTTDLAEVSPFALRGHGKQVIADGAATQQMQGAEVPVLSNDEADRQLPSLDHTLSEADFVRWVDQLRIDPDLLNALIDQFRQETDPARKQRLADLLGAIGGEQITQLAGELVSSGDAASRALGMSLLQDVQAGNAQARDMVSAMLSTELETPSLVDAITALADPGEVDGNSRRSMADQLAMLTSHGDDAVRSISLDVLSRWSHESQYTEILIAGLDDESQYVRAAAAYALAGRDDDTSAMLVDRLFRVASDPNEPRRVRRAAVQTLNSLTLTQAQGTQLDLLERQINTVIR